MKRVTKTIALLLCLALLGGSLLACSQADPAPLQEEATPSPAPVPESTPVEAVPPIAELTEEDVMMHFLQLLIAEQYEAAADMLAELAASQVQDAGGLAAFMDTLRQQTGAWQSAEGEATLVHEQGGVRTYMMVFVAEQGRYVMQASLDEDRKIGGFVVQPMAEAEPPFTMPEGFAEDDITLDAGTGYPLEGRVVYPKDAEGPVPTVVLVHGSGPLDFDETVGANRVFGKLAKGLAERGIATLRYDKRTYRYPEISQAGDFSVKEEYVEDVLAAVQLLREQPWADPENLFILGHSEGGMLAPMFLAEGADVKGMILFAGTPRKFIDILKDQQQDLLDYYGANGMQTQIDAYREMQAGWEAEAEAWRNMTEEETKSASPVYGMGAYYLYVLEQYDALETIARLKKPTLILQGGQDMQVYADTDYAIYEKAFSKAAYVRMKLYDGLGHLFTPSLANSIMEAQQEYNAPADIPAEVMDDIADWIVNQR